MEEIEYLGYTYNQTGSKPQQQYINKILKFKKPTTKKEIKSFLGMVQYIARYVHKLADWTHHLNIILQAENKFQWGRAQDDAFNKIQSLVANIQLYRDNNFKIQKTHVYK